MKDKWTKGNTIAQFIIAALILLTVVVATISIRQQHKFNRKTLRPWLGLRPYPQLATIDDTLVFGFSFYCGGYSPAINVCLATGWYIHDSIVTFNMTGAAPAIVVPGETLSVSNRKVQFKAEPKLNNEGLVNLLKQNRLFMHIIAYYEDFDGNKYNLYVVFHAKDYQNNRINSWTFVKVRFDDKSLERTRPILK